MLKNSKNLFFNFFKLHIINVPGERVAYVAAINRLGDKSQKTSRN
jgi:hypothetical protein